jgi:hypothetical protein
MNECAHTAANVGKVSRLQLLSAALPSEQVDL